MNESDQSLVIQSKYMGFHGILLWTVERVHDQSAFSWKKRLSDWFYFGSKASPPHGELKLPKMTMVIDEEFKYFKVNFRFSLSHKESNSIPLGKLRLLMD